MTNATDRMADNLLTMAAMVRDKAVELEMSDVAETPLPELALMLQDIIKSAPRGERAKMLGITLN